MGWAGDEEPAIVFRSAVARTRGKKVMSLLHHQQHMLVCTLCVCVSLCVCVCVWCVCDVCVCVLHDRVRQTRCV